MTWLEGLPPESPNVAVGPYLESQFTAPDARCPHPHRWSTMDAQSTENEVIELAAGLVRGLQPDVCLETGTSRGFLARAIGAALDANGHGVLHTYEPHVETFKEAMVTTANHARVVCHNEPSMVPWEWGPIDFAWFDSLLSLRMQEFVYYSEWFHEGTVVCFHDTAPRFGAWSNNIRIQPRLSWVEFPTPRGLIVARWLG